MPYVAPTVAAASRFNELHRSQLRLKPELLPTRKFRAWVKGYGVLRLARGLGLTYTAVNHWIRPTGSLNLPTRITARELIALSVASRHSPGPLSWEDLYGAVELEGASAHGGSRITGRGSARSGDQE